jgi:hypothetical protein
MYWLVWFTVDDTKNMHRDCIRAESAEEAETFLRAAWPQHTIIIKKVGILP